MALLKGHQGKMQNKMLIFIKGFLLLTLLCFLLTAKYPERALFEGDINTSQLSRQ